MMRDGIAKFSSRCIVFTPWFLGQGILILPDTRCEKQSFATAHGVYEAMSGREPAIRRF